MTGMARSLRLALFLLGTALIAPSLGFLSVPLPAPMVAGRLSSVSLRTGNVRSTHLRGSPPRMCEDKDKGGGGELDLSALQRRISQVKVKDGMEEDRQVPFELPCTPARPLHPDREAVVRRS